MIAGSLPLRNCSARLAVRRHAARSDGRRLALQRALPAVAVRSCTEQRSPSTPPAASTFDGKDGAASLSVRPSEARRPFGAGQRAGHLCRALDRCSRFDSG